MIKIKNYLVIISILLNYNLFAAKQKLSIERSNPSILKIIATAKDENNRSIVLNVSNTHLPSKAFEDQFKKNKHRTYFQMDTADQKIVQSLSPDQERNNFVLFNYVKKRTFGKDSNYSIYERPTSYQGGKIYYYFSWKKKSYSKLQGFEKQLADYYNANDSSAIEFLYSWKNYEEDPWAIKLDNTMHTTIWLKAEPIDKNRKQGLEDFFDLKFTDENKKLSLLIDENNHIIAKRIGYITTFREKK